MSRSIYWKITVPFALLILVGMGILGNYTINSVRNVQVDNLRSQLLKEARIVARESAPSFSGTPDPKALDAMAKGAGREIDARITLITRDGVVLGDTHEDPSTLENHSTRPEVKDALASGIGESTRYSVSTLQTMMYLAVSVVSGGNIVGIARVSVPLTAVESSVDVVTRTIAIAVAIGALLTVLAAAAIARMITRPVRQLTSAAQKIAAGDLDYRIHPGTSDEIGRLGDAFNEMSASLKGTLAAISEEKTKLAAVLSGIADGVVMTDGQGLVLLANPAAERLFGFLEAAAKGRPLIEAIRDYEIAGLFKRCIETSLEQTGEVDSSGSRFLRVIVVPLAGKKPAGTLLLFQDLTEMRSVQTMRREFVGNVSHELRTPLTAIKAIVETLQDGAMEDQAVARDFLDKIDGEVDGMTEMVSELIELSRIETGKVKLKLEPVNVSQLVEEGVGHLSHQAERQKVSLSTEVTPDLPDPQADKGRVRQVLVNIVHNAIKFTPPGGKISVSARRLDDSILFEVTDTGIGISKEDLPHIFERFFKADRSRSSGGTGLGLAIARHTVYAHGGSIRAQSEEGKGSTFSFSVPLKPPRV